MRNKYTDAEMKILLNNLCVLVDTREQVWNNIEEYFKKSNIQYRREKLNQGDYSICIMSNEETKPLGINRDMYFDNEIVIERKASIDEVAGNMKEPDRTRLKKEFSYLKSKGTKIHFFLQDENYDINLRKGAYRSEYNPKALFGSIKTFESEFGFIVRPVHESIIGSEIYYTLYYYVKNKLLGK
ncbi:MAG: ERCC4 domain-containing protein [Peptostreptococcaceae bacterium]|nr:ERCC4 domain-containing protein [Peptostreptococcaceae bacterium]